MSPEYITRPLPPNFNETGCAVAFSGRNNRRGKVFVKAPDGTVYHIGPPWTLDMLAEHSTNAQDRSAYAKLAGVKVKDINAARKTKAAEWKKAKFDRDFRYAQRDAGRLGYRLVPK